MPRIPAHAPPPPPLPPDPPAGADGPGVAGGAPTGPGPAPAPGTAGGPAAPESARGSAAAGAAGRAPDRVEAPPPPPLSALPGAAWRPLVARVALSRGPGAGDVARSLEALAADPRGEVILLKATADGRAFGAALGAEAARRGLAPADAERAGSVTSGVVARILGERVRAAAASQLTAKIDQVTHLEEVMRGRVDDPAALTAFFRRFGAVPATAREAVLDAHHLGVAGHLTGDPTLYLFSDSAAGARARAELVATGHTEIVGTPVSLREMADGLETLRGELEAARDYAWRAPEPLLVFRPLVRRLAARDPRYAEAFALRRQVTGGAALTDPARFGVGVDLWNRLRGRDADLARAMWAAGVVDHGEVTHARAAWVAYLGGQAAGVGLGVAALPDAVVADLGATLETRVSRTVDELAEKVLSGSGKALIERLGRQAAVARLTARVRAEAERRLGPVVEKTVARAAEQAGVEDASRLARSLLRPVAAAVGNGISRAASRAVAAGVEGLLGDADPRTERVAHQLGAGASRAVGTVLGSPGASLGGLVAGYLAPERRVLDDPTTAVAPGFRWDGGVPSGPGGRAR